MDKHQVRQFSPIGEEPILEEGTAHCFNYTAITSTPSSSTLKTATPKKYNLRPKRFSFSTPKTPKMNRYSSCSNIKEWVELGKFCHKYLYTPKFSYLPKSHKLNKDTQIYYMSRDSSKVIFCLTFTIFKRCPHWFMFVFVKGVDYFRAYNYS